MPIFRHFTQVLSTARYSWLLVYVEVAVDVAAVTMTLVDVAAVKLKAFLTKTLTVYVPGFM